MTKVETAFMMLNAPEYTCRGIECCECCLQGGEHGTGCTTVKYRAKPTAAFKKQLIMEWIKDNAVEVFTEVL